MVPESARRSEYVVDTSRLTREQEVDACRAALQVVRPYVDRFQCDVPWDNRGAWPHEVVEAANVLAPLPVGPTSKETYQMTGWVSDFEDETWDAFVTFAPYAFSADAWTADMNWLLSVSDEGTRLSVRVTQDRLGDFKHSVIGADVVPTADWNRRRNEEWRLRQNRRQDNS